MCWRWSDLGWWVAGLGLGGNSSQPPSLDFNLASKLFDILSEFSVRDDFW